MSARRIGKLAGGTGLAQPGCRRVAQEPEQVHVIRRNRLPSAARDIPLERNLPYGQSAARVDSALTSFGDGMTGEVKTIHPGPRVVGTAGWPVVNTLTAQAIDDKDKSEATKIEGKAVHVFAEGVMLVCVDRKLALELIRAMANMKPERVIVRLSRARPRRLAAPTHVAQSTGRR